MIQQSEESYFSAINGKGVINLQLISVWKFCFFLLKERTIARQHLNTKLIVEMHLPIVKYKLCSVQEIPVYSIIKTRVNETGILGYN